MRRQLRHARVLAGAAMLSASVLAGCSDLLDVKLPGRVPEEALNDPALTSVLVNSVKTDFECAWANYVAGTALISDQFIQASGNLVQRNWGTRRVDSSDASYATAGCGSPYGIYSPLHIARYQSEDIYKRITEFPDALVANKTLSLATVRVYGGWALLALGEGFCEMAIDGGELMTRSEVMALAEERFTEGLALATQVNNADMKNLALAGRARVRLDLSNLSGAIADASLVPAGYVKNASRDETAAARYNPICSNVTCPSYGRNGSIAPNFRDLKWQGVSDPRVKITTQNKPAFDNATIHWYPVTKASTRAEAMKITSYAEAQLIVAEASARNGDLATARRIINTFHTAAGIPGYDPNNTATKDEVVKQVIEERVRELFLDGGLRFNDHYRFQGTPYAVPYKGEPGSIHPNGIDHTGVPYGNTKCFPLPDVERVGNPNINK
ncbi:MAG TPA: RagB/SusD family nutrient uptake outer membrane protein [Longimicrobiales bacterium]|nr:RagB/SusD family nutrient uptake outer membrane protein [Longimicrobiales bacterium]